MRIRYEIPHHPEGPTPEKWDWYTLESPAAPHKGDYLEWTDENGKVSELLVGNVMWTPQREYDLLVVAEW